jgi:hypothetical protein
VKKVGVGADKPMPGSLGGSTFIELVREHPVLLACMLELGELAIDLLDNMACHWVLRAGLTGFRL